MLRDSVERVLASSIVTSMTRGRLRGQALILAYHAITPDSERGHCGERSLYVHQRMFRDHLDAIRDVADVVPLDELGGDHAADRPRVSITFDDAYHGAVTCAIDELESRGMPATIFVAPGYLGGQVFWWDALAHTAGEMPESMRTRALDTLRGDGEAILRWATANGVTVTTNLPQHARSATVEQLLAAARRPGITLGSHTWSHANVARLSGEALANEMIRPREWLEAHAPAGFVKHLAYPYGLESAEARTAAQAAGYDSALRITGGWHHPSRAMPFARPRLNVGSGMTVAGLRARLLGSRRT